MAGLEVVTGPTQEPITINSIRDHLRLDELVDDIQINGYIIAARQWAENYTGRFFIQRTMRQWYDARANGFHNLIEGTVTGHQNYFTSSQHLEVAATPIISVDSIKYYNDAGTESTWDADNYYADTVSDIGRIMLRDGGSFPTDLRKLNGLAVNFTVGYGATAATVPQAIKIAIMQYITFLYEHRGEFERFPAPTPPAVLSTLLNPYKVMRFSASPYSQLVTSGIA